MCCNNNKLTRDFATGFINSTNSYEGDYTFGIVRFATYAHKETDSLIEAGPAIDKIEQLAYSGGFTNTGQAIKQCAELLDDFGTASHSVIVVITDGIPTRSTDGRTTNAQHLAYAIDQADLAKVDHKIVGVTVNTVSTVTQNVKDML